MQTPAEFETALAQDHAFGPEAAAAVMQLLNHPVYGRHVTFIPYHQRRARPAALAPLRAQLQGQAPLSGLAQAVSRAATAAISLLPLRRVMPDETFQRASSNEPGLLAAALALLTVGERIAATTTLPFSLAEVRFLLLVVRCGQGALQVLRAAHDRLDDNLASWETRLLELLREYYPYLAAVAANDEEQLARLEATRVYLYGPAAQSVVTRRGNERKLETLTEKAAAAGQAQAHEQARAAATSELRSLIEAHAAGKLGQGPAAPTDRSRP